MFEGFPREMIEFMLQIRLNNNKEFMSTHREEYERVMKQPYYGLIEALTPVALRIDPGMEVRPNKVLSRIFRDTRFSNDKSPYRDHHWLAFRHAGESKDTAVMLWFEVRMEYISWGLGYWGENRPAMDIFRRRLISHPGDWTGLLKTLEGTGLSVEGEKYKRLVSPVSLPPPLDSHYPMKSLYISRNSAPYNVIFTPKLAEMIITDYETLAPFYRLLRGYYELSLLEGVS